MKMDRPTGPGNDERPAEAEIDASSEATARTNNTRPIVTSRTIPRRRAPWDRSTHIAPTAFVTLLSRNPSGVQQGLSALLVDSRPRACNTLWCNELAGPSLCWAANGQSHGLGARSPNRHRPRTTPSHGESFLLRTVDDEQPDTSDNCTENREKRNTMDHELDRDDYRLRVLIERMQREGRPERDIEAAVRSASAPMERGSRNRSRRPTGSAFSVDAWVRATDRAVARPRTVSARGPWFTVPHSADRPSGRLGPDANGTTRDASAAALCASHVVLAANTTPRLACLAASRTSPGSGPRPPRQRSRR